MKVQLPVEPSSLTPDVAYAGSVAIMSGGTSKIFNNINDTVEYVIGELIKAKVPTTIDYNRIKYSWY